MPLEANQGTVDLNSIVTDRIKLDRSELIEYVHPNNAPYFMLLSMLGFEGCSAEKFEFFTERDDFTSTIQVTVAANTTATSLTVSANDAYRVVNGQQLFCPRTQEHMIVTATPTTATGITVTRGISGTSTGTGVALLSGDTLFVGPTVMEYGSTPVDTINLEAATDYNYVEYNRKGWKVDGRAQAVDLYGPNALVWAKEDNVRAFMREQEIKHLFGVRAKNTISSKTRTFSGGINWYLKKSGSRALTKDFSGIAITRNELDNTLQTYCDQAGGPESKMVVCGWNLIRIINGFGRDLLVMNDKYSKVGLTVRTYQSDFGEINLMPHKLWNTELNMTDEAWIIDMDNMKRRGLPGRSDITMTTTRGSNDLQAEGEDAVHQELGVEDGLELRNTQNFAVLSGIQA